MLNLSGREGGRGRYAMIAALLVVICASGALATWVLLRKSDKAQPPPAPPKDGVPHVCLECRHEFLMTPDDFRKYRESLANDDRGNTRLVHCPKCGGRHCGYWLSRCPKCGKYYLPYGLEATRKLVRGEPVPPGEPNVCPHCGTDIAAYWVQEARNKGR